MKTMRTHKVGGNYEFYCIVYNYMIAMVNHNFHNPKKNEIFAASTIVLRRSKIWQAKISI